MIKRPVICRTRGQGDIRQGEDGRGWRECGVGLWSTARIESTSNGRRHISLAAKRAGEPSAGNRHARFDVAGAGNGVGHLTTAPVLDPTGRTYGETAPERGEMSPAAPPHHSRAAIAWIP